MYSNSLIIKKNQANWIILSLLAFSMFFKLNDNINIISLYIIIPIITLITITKSFRTIIKSKMIVSYSLLVSWMYVSSLFAEYQEISFNIMFTISAGFLISTTIYSISKNYKNIKYLYIFYIIFSFILIYYASTKIGATFGLERANNEQLNANTVAYFLFYATFSFFMIYNMSNSNSEILYYLIILAIILITLYVSLITASRQVLIIQIPLLICIAFLRLIKYKKNRLIRLLFIFLLLSIFVIPPFIKYYSGSLLESRSQINATDDIRYTLLINAFKMGIENPILGVGPDNYNILNGYNGFSHCTYSELFVSSGIIPLILFLTILIRFTKKQFMLYRKLKDINFLYFFLFGVFFMIDNIFFVFTHDIWLMPFFFLVVGHSEVYRTTLQKYLNVN